MLGVKLNGKREVLGMWVGGNECKILVVRPQRDKKPGVEDIMIISVDGLTGFGDANSCSLPTGRIKS